MVATHRRGKHANPLNPQADQPQPHVPPDIAHAVDQLIDAAKGSAYEIVSSSNPMVVYVRRADGPHVTLGEPVYLGHDEHGRYRWCWRTGSVIAWADQPRAVLARIDYLFEYTKGAS